MTPSEMEEQIETESITEALTGFALSILLIGGFLGIAFNFVPITSFIKELFL